MTSEIFLLAQQQSMGGFGGIPMGYLLIMGLSMLASMMVGGMLKRRFAEYSQIPLRITGAQVAQLMLQQNGITDVKVMSTPGKLTDHYDPVSKTVNLSEGVYDSNSVAAAAVAAHECGHAVQHQQAYAWLGLRSKLVPMVQLSSNLLGIVLGIGVMMMFATHNPMVLWIGVALLAVTTLFAVVTLPVEFDASRRALVWLESSGIAASMEHSKAKNALFWAAMTYVVAALGSIATLVYYVMMAMGGRRNQ